MERDPVSLLLLLTPKYVPGDRIRHRMRLERRSRPSDEPDDDDVLVTWWQQSRE